MKDIYKSYLKEGPSDSIAFIEYTDDNLDNILETISAFSNTIGGIMFVGVSKNGRIKGVNPFETEEFLMTLNETYFKNRIDLKFEKVKDRHAFFYILHIKEIINKPLFFSKGTKKCSYIRCGVENIEAYNILNQIWKFTADSKKHSPSSDLSDDEHLLLSAFKKAGVLSYNKLQTLVDLPISMFEECLVRLISNGHVTYSYDNKSIMFHVG